MAEALLINRNDLAKFTSLNGNVDTDKFVQYIKIAQDIHLQEILGTKLLNRIKSDIDGNNLQDPYLSLVTNYIKQVLIHYAMVEYLPFSAYTIANKGVYKHGAENSESVSKNEVDYLVEKERKTAESYRQRLIDYIIYHSSDFPEYFQNRNEDVFPSNDNYFTGWVI